MFKIYDLQLPVDIGVSDDGVAVSQNVMKAYTEDFSVLIEK